MRIRRALAAATLSGLLLPGLAACSGSPAPAPAPRAGLASDAPATLSAAPGPPRVLLGDVRRGPRPRIGYVHQDTYVAPDGTRTLLAVDRGVAGVVSLGDGFLVREANSFEGYTGLVLSGPGRHRLAEWSTTGSPVVSRDGRQVAWASATSSEASVKGPTAVYLAAGDAGPGEWLRQDLPHHPTVTGVLGREIVYEVMFGQGAWITDLHDPPRRIPGAADLVDLDETHRRLVVKRGDSRTHVADLDSGRLLWTARGTGYQLGRFSPDGSRVLGSHYRRDGGQDWAFFDAGTGRLVREIALPTGFRVEQVAWEGPRRLLMVTSRARETAILRAGLDGTLERATRIEREDVFEPPYVLGSVS